MLEPMMEPMLGNAVILGEPSSIESDHAAGDTNVTAASPMTLDHICLAVRSIEAAGKRITDVLGYREKTAKVTNTRQQVNVSFYAKEGSLDLKLIEPTDNSSPLIAFLKRGEGLHHLAFRVSNVEAAAVELEARGARATAQPQPGEAFDDGLIAFLHCGSGLNFEIIDTDKRRMPLSEVSLGGEIRTVVPMNDARS